MIRQMLLGIRLRDDATFDSYLGEAGERLSVSSGLVYLWGHPGSGRSHLLQACCHQARKAGHSAIFLDSPVEYDSGVLQGLESVQVVCLDDMDTVTGDDQWQLDLFHLINAVRDAGGNLIISAAMPVQALPIRLPDLHSRLLAAMSIQTDRLSDEQKLHVLQQRAVVRGFRLSEEVGRFIMGHTPRSLSSLIDLLERLDEETLVQQRKVTIPLVKEMLGI